MLTTVAVLVIVLGLMVAIAGDVRRRSAERVTRDLLWALDQAMAQYQQTYHALPPVTSLVPGPQSQEKDLLPRAEANNLQLVAALQQLRRDIGEPLEGIPLDPAATPHELRDSWGGPIVFMPQHHPLIGMAAGDRHFFVSAGPDGRFLTISDNLVSYEQTTPIRAP